MTNLEILKQLAECVALADEITEETGYETGLADLLSEAIACLRENLCMENVELDDIVYPWEADVKKLQIKRWMTENADRFDVECIHDKATATEAIADVIFSETDISGNYNEIYNTVYELI